MDYVLRNYYWSHVWLLHDKWGDVSDEGTFKSISIIAVSYHCLRDHINSWCSQNTSRMVSSGNKEGDSKRASA